VYSPVSGKVTAANPALATQPELLNHEPYGDGWLFRLQPDAPLDGAALMSAADYAKYVTDQA